MDPHRRYIHQHPDWPHMRWDAAAIAEPMSRVRFAQGQLLGQLGSLGIRLQREAELATLTAEIVQSSAIEGEHLDQRQVQSSVARRLGLPDMALHAVERRIAGVVELTMDATTEFAAPLSADRLFRWHTLLFPDGWNDAHRITVGTWRDAGMQVVSYTSMGLMRVHFEAPEAEVVPREMDRFFAWFNDSDAQDWVVRAAVAHLWFVTVHPFDDGNGRIGRAISEMALARSDQSAQRCYSMSAQIRREQKDYYAALGEVQGATTDITPWVLWFLGCLERALGNARQVLDQVLEKSRVLGRIGEQPMNERQLKVLNRLMENFEGKLTAEKWAKLARCSHNTALRDIQDLIAKGILERNPEGGRSTSYRLAPDLAPPL